MKNTIRFVIICISFVVMPLYAQDNAAFGFSSETISPSENSVVPLVALKAKIKTTGSISSGAQTFLENRSDFPEANILDINNIFSGKLHITASGENAEAVVKLNLNGNTLYDATKLKTQFPSIIDEAYVGSFFGKLDVEAGLRKISWGKADSQGPLDVVNPLDLTDLTVADSLKQKIARPMIHASFSLGSFTRIEGVYIPFFEGHRIATEGRWVPSEINALKDGIKLAANKTGPVLVSMGAITLPQMYGALSSLGSFDPATLYPDTTGFEYFQGGGRVSTTVLSSDIGFQYYYGLLPKPAVAIDTDKLFSNALVLNPDAIQIAYNRYHQLGADCAMVLGSFNVRSEIAAVITEDLAGDDGEVYNPSVVYSVGFDRDLFAQINLNAQGNGSVRLMENKIGEPLFDIEANTDMTRTQITVQLSKKFLKDEIEVKAVGIYGVEDVDFLVMPALVWTKGDAEFTLAGGLFGGNNDGELGQYSDNTYGTVTLLYRF